MRTSEVLPRPELIRSSKIGAYELKSAMKINTIKGFLLTNATAVTLAVGLLFAGVFANETVKNKPIPFAGPIEVTIFNPENKPDKIDNIELPKSEMIKLMTNMISGNPIPVPVAEIIDMEYADMKNIDNSLSNTDGKLVGADEIKTMDFNKNLNVSNSIVESNETDIPSETGYYDYSREPDIDLASLNAAIVYPEIAQKIGAEGKVTISVLIDEKGNVIKTNIKTTSNNMFNNAAIDAVKKAVFTPALQGDKAVKSWLTIPIVFKLK